MTAPDKISSVETDLWRWDGLEEEYRFPIVGYIVSVSDGLLLVDPPVSPGLKDEILQLGDPAAVVITSPWHVRGGPHWARTFGIPIAAPRAAAAELREAGAEIDVLLTDGYQNYGWQVIHLTADAYDEVALWHPAGGKLIVGDLLTDNEQGGIALGPNKYMQVPMTKLQPLVERLAGLRPRLILSAHVGPRENASDLLSAVLASITGDS